MNKEKRQLVVRIVKSWDYPDLMRQTPNGSGIWDNIKFTLEAVKKCDFLVVLNRSQNKLKIRVPQKNKWLFVQEPPIKNYEWLQKSYTHFDRVFSFEEPKVVPHQEYDQTALPWHIDKTFDELVQLKKYKISKKDEVSWITSCSTNKPGQKIRMQFKDYLLNNNFPLHLMGRGFKPIKDKFDGIAPYKYSIAFENNVGNYYFTEKIIDCFLSWTMPIYYGCQNILDFFPKDSMILLNPQQPQKALAAIKEAQKKNTWQKNIKAISEARNLILYKYQFFPFIVEKIKQEISKPDYDSTGMINIIPANDNPNIKLNLVDKTIRVVKNIYSNL